MKMPVSERLEVNVASLDACIQLAYFMMCKCKNSTLKWNHNQHFGELEPWRGC